MYDILAYLQRKSVNYDLFLLFETENLHLKYFLYECLHFVLGSGYLLDSCADKLTKILKNVFVGKQK